jgi:phosphoglycerate dehydrogenase-like enzyme
MQIFNLKVSGDLSNKPEEQVGLDVLKTAPHLRYSFIEHQQPGPNEADYPERIFKLRVRAGDVAGADGLVVCTPYVQAEAFAKGAENLVVIGRMGIGYDKIDLAACTANDVAVFNSPNGLTHSTAVGAMFFIIALSKRYYIQERLTRERRWDLGKYAGGDDLAGLTLGIIGLGKTGFELARLMAPFRMRVIAYSLHADPAKAEEAGIELVGSMDEVLKKADYLSLHGRLDQRTRGMIGERELALMKPTAFFVNVARGEMVDEEALTRALRERRIAAAGLDVFHVEPLPADSPLMKLDNVILTQHTICGSRQAGRATNLAVMQGILRIARGELPDNILNPDVLDRPGFRAKLNRHKPKMQSGKEIHP